MAGGEEKHRLNSLFPNLAGLMACIVLGYAEIKVAVNGPVNGEKWLRLVLKVGEKWFSIHGI